MHPQRTLLSIVIALSVLVAAAAQDIAADPSEPRYVTDELLVRFRPGTSPLSIANLHAAIGAQLMRTFGVVRDLQLVRLPLGMTVQRARESYLRDAGVLYAEPNYLRRTTDAPNDPRYPELWAMHNTGQSVGGSTAGRAGADIKALEAWALTTGSSNVVVGIIDTGVDYNHQDLAANMYRNEADCNQNGVDDDGNGYVDDCYGIDTYNNDSDPMDDYDHGTHVAGTIGAVGNNALGVVGVNWTVKILACKFLGADGWGTDAGAIACLEYFDVMKDRGVNLVATSNSWGGAGYSQALYDAIDNQRRRGVLFIAAAANSGEDNDGAWPNYPSSYRLSNVIGVAATDNQDHLAVFSNYGRRSVHLGAPGVDILSTTRGNTYKFFSGTSMATPHVTGVAALLKAQDPARDFKAIRNLLLTGGDPLTALDKTIAQRRLNALGSLTCSNSVVYAPLGPSARVMTTTGRGVTFTALHINCALPNGGTEVTITPGGNKVTLVDDGQNGDQDANDGIYSGTWIPPAPGVYTFTFASGETGIISVDPYSYVASPYQYRAIAGNSLSLQDDYYGWVSSPFPLNFAGLASDGVYLSDNGVMTFSSGNLGAGNKPLPNAQSSTLIAPFWDDLLPLDPKQHNVFWDVRGAAPQRELVVEWRDLGHVGCASDGSETVKFQVVFFENSTDLLFNYADTVFGGNCVNNDAGASATVGLQLTTDVARQYSYESASLADNTALMWHAELPVNPVPVITTLDPATAVMGDYGYLVTIKGSNFQPGAITLWNGAPRYAYFISESEIWAVVYGADLAKTGTFKMAVYNPLPGGGSSNELDFAVVNPDFALTLSKSVLNVKYGQVDTTTVTLQQKPVFRDPVSLSCSGLPAGLTCSFSPTTITYWNPSSTLTVALTSTAMAPSTTTTAQRRPGPFDLLWLPVAGVIFAAVGGRRQRRRTLLLAALVVALLVTAQVGCGGGGGSATSSNSSKSGSGTTLSTSTYKFDVVGTAGSVQRSVTVTLNVTK